MGRRIDTGENDVSLFPFLSILACVIGVLTLMISTLALSQMDSDVVVQAEEFDAVVSDVAQQRSAIAELQQKIVKQQQAATQTSEKQKDVLNKQKKIQQLEAQIILAQKKRTELNKNDDPQQIPSQQPLAELETELKGLNDQAAQLSIELENKQKPPEAAEVTVIPGGSGRGIKPYFVECRKNGIVLHDSKGLVQVRPANIDKSPPFLKLLDSVKGNTNGKLIFLIREDGISSWRRAKQFADSLEVANGKLPVLGQGKLNFDRVGR